MAEQKLSRVALIGLGVMGGGMARQLLSNGWPLLVYARRREAAQPFAEAGAKITDSPRAAAENAEIVISMVSDDHASRAVWTGPNGAIEGAKSGTAFIECSTLSPSWVAELAKAASAKGCQLLDAPVTGSKAHAASGELQFLVGGDPDALERAKPVFAAMGRRTLHLGPVGSGARMKLINNFLCGVQAAALAEALTVAGRCGLSIEAVVDVLTNGAPGSPLVKTLSPRMVERSYEPNFILRLMEKDLGYAIEMARDEDVPLRTAVAARELFHDASQTPWADKDFSAVIEPLRSPKHDQVPA